MNKKIRVMTATYRQITVQNSEARKIRGFFADQNQEDENLHNHTPEGEQVYRYPIVQYKVIGGHPVVVAIEDGIRSIHPLLMQAEELTIGEKVYTDTELDLHLAQLPVGDCRNTQHYRFVTPWLALNQKNFEQYETLDQEERDALLSRILIGNLLSMCKGLGVTLEQKIEVTHSLKPIAVSYKGKSMIGFRGEFYANCFIPNLCGIGKGTARGFGTVKLIQEKEEDTDAASERDDDGSMDEES